MAAEEKKNMENELVERRRSARKCTLMPKIRLLDVGPDDKMSAYEKKIEKLKNSGKYEQFRKEECLRNAVYRLDLKGEDKINYNNKAKARMRRYRERQKEKRQEKPLTRNEEEKIKKKKEDIREYNRIKKRESRAAQSSQKARRNKERDLEYRTNKRKRDSEENEGPSSKERRLLPTEINKIFSPGTTNASNTNLLKSTENIKPKPGFSNSASRRKAISRAKARLPTDPTKWVDTITGLLKNASPRKQKLLTESGFTVPSSLNLNANEDMKSKVTENMLLKLNSIKKKRDKKSAVIRNTYKDLIPKKYKKIRKNRQKKLNQQNISEEEKQIIHEIYIENAVCLPTRKSVSRKTLKAKSVLTRTVKSLYKVYLNRSSRKVCFSLFASCRPINIIPIANTHLNQCLCEKCANCNLKLTALNNITKNTLKIEDKYEAVSMTMCQKVDNHKYHNKKCIDRNCERCGVKLIKTKLGSIVEEKDMITWREWGMDNIKGKQRKSLLFKSGTAKELTDRLCVELQTLSSHLFVAGWQYDQAKILKENLPGGTVMVEADFSENYRCEYQDEVQSAHWSYNQITVHPVVCHYRCAVCEAIIRESLVIITDDLIHDAASVHTFMERVHCHLTGQRNLLIDKYIQFTDGCGSQYKSKVPFYDVSNGVKDVPVTRNYFGSNHGKGPCDGLGAVTKQKTRLAVKTGTVIQNAEDMVSFLNHNMIIESTTCFHGHTNPRSFILVKDIVRNAEIKQMKTLPGTRQLHAIKGVKSGEVKYRSLSCYCESCMQEQYLHCANLDVVGNWKPFSIVKTCQTETIEPLPSDDIQPNPNLLGQSEELLEISGLTATLDLSFILDGLDAPPTDCSPTTNCPPKDEGLVASPTDAYSTDDGLVASTTDCLAAPPIDSLAAPPTDCSPTTNCPPKDEGLVASPTDAYSTDDGLDASTTDCLAAPPIDSLAAPPTDCSPTTNCPPKDEGLVASPTDAYSTDDGLVASTTDCSAAPPIDSLVVPTANGSSEIDGLSAHKTTGSLTTDGLATPSTDDSVAITDDSTNTTTSERYCPGRYVSVSHGASVYPAVVVDWPYVKYFKPAGNLWLESELLHSIIITDVIKVLQPPDIIMNGSRVGYKFELLSINVRCCLPKLTLKNSVISLGSKYYVSITTNRFSTGKYSPINTLWCQKDEWLNNKFPLTNSNSLGDKNYCNNQVFSDTFSSSTLSNDVKIYNCNDCNKSFKTQSYLLRHQKLHVEEKLYTCQVCGKAFKLPQYLKRHLLSHTEERPYKCEICKKYFKTKKILNVHLQLHSNKRPFKCDVCEKSFKTSYYLKIHCKIHNYPYKCDMCEKSFKSSNSLKLHYRIHKNSYKCDVCEKSFRTYSQWSEHNRIHTGEKPFKCDVCDRAFSTNKLLKVHYRIHTGEKPYSCKVCEKSFRTSSQRNAHKIVHTRERPYKCDLCEMSFKTNRQLLAHSKTHTNLVMMKCDTCGKPLNSSDNNKESYCQCKISSNNLKKTSARLSNTLESDVDQEPATLSNTFQSIQNSAGAINTLENKTVLNTVGSSNRLKKSVIMCNSCGMTFRKHFDLKIHMRVHTGEKPYACYICKESFSQWGSLHRHLKRHTGVKDYTCDICSKSFTRRSTLNVHMLLHKRPYHCDMCYKTFNCKNKLERHILTHTLNTR